MGGAASDGDRAGQTDHLHWAGAGTRGAIAQLARAIGAPRPDRVIGADRQGMVIAGADGHHVGQAARADRR